MNKYHEALINGEVISMQILKPEDIKEPWYHFFGVFLEELESKEIIEVFHEGKLTEEEKQENIELEKYAVEHPEDFIPSAEVMKGARALIKRLQNKKAK